MRLHLYNIRLHVFDITVFENIFLTKLLIIHLHEIITTICLYLQYHFYYFSVKYFTLKALHYKMYVTYVYDKIDKMETPRFMTKTNFLVCIS